MKTSAKAKEKSRDCIVYLTFREETTTTPEVMSLGNLSLNLNRLPIDRGFTGAILTEIVG